MTSEIDETLLPCVKMAEVLELGKSSLRHIPQMIAEESGDRLNLLCDMLSAFDVQFEADLQEYFATRTPANESGGAEVWREVTSSLNKVLTKSYDFRTLERELDKLAKRLAALEAAALIEKERKG